VVEPEPERARGRELGVADRMSMSGMPMASARARNPTPRIIWTRFEIVMVSRSLEAAKAMSVGNRINLTASTIMASA
jgi:hypothetical protein